MKLTSCEKRITITFGVACIVMILSSLVMLGGCGAAEGSDKNNVTPGAESVTTSGQFASKYMT